MKNLLFLNQHPIFRDVVKFEAQEANAFDSIGTLVPLQVVSKHLTLTASIGSALYVLGFQLGNGVLIGLAMAILITCFYFIAKRDLQCPSFLNILGMTGVLSGAIGTGSTGMPELFLMTFIIKTLI